MELCIMNIRWQRFINQRTALIVSMMLLVSFFLLLRDGYFTRDQNRQVYQQFRLIVDASCDITQTGCNSSADGIRLRLELKDSPGALQAFPAHVHIDGLQNPAQLDVRVIFSMQGMDMGDLRQKLVFNQQSGEWSGQVILPICTSGRSDWLARVEVIDGKKIYAAEYAFILQN
jgi:hypothetical protein